MTKRVCIDLDSMIQGVIREVAARAYAGAVSPRLLPSTVGDEFKNLSREDFLAIDGFCRDCRLGHTLSGYMNGLESLALNNPKSEDLSLLIEYLNKAIRSHRQGNLEAAEAWLNALYVGLKAANVFLPKAQIAFKQSDALPAAQQAGGMKTKENWEKEQEEKRADLRPKVESWLEGLKDSVLPKATNCRNHLKRNNQLDKCTDDKALEVIRDIFREKGLLKPRTGKSGRPSKKSE